MALELLLMAFLCAHVTYKRRPRKRTTRRCEISYSTATRGAHTSMRVGIPQLRDARGFVFRRGVGGDGYDGDGQGRRFWAVSHCPLGEAPFSAPQAKKNLGPKCHFTEFCVVFEWVSHGSSSRILWEMDPRFGGHRYPTLQYVYRVVTRCWKGVIKHILKPFISSVRSHEATSLRFGPTPTSIRPTQPPAGAAVSVCALAHPCAAERRLTVTGPCVHRRLHTSFPCPF